MLLVCVKPWRCMVNVSGVSNKVCCKVCICLWVDVVFVFLGLVCLVIEACMG